MRIPRGDIAAVAPQQVRPGRIQHVGIGRAAAMVAKPRDSSDVQFLQALQTNVVPGEIGSVGAVRRNSLPEHGVANRLDPEAGDPVEIFDTLTMFRLCTLVAEVVADPCDRALQSAPKLKWLFHQPTPSFYTVVRSMCASCGLLHVKAYDASAVDDGITFTVEVSASEGSASLMRRNEAIPCPTIWSML